MVMCHRRVRSHVFPTLSLVGCRILSCTGQLYWVAATSRRHRGLCTGSQSAVETPYPNPSAVLECCSFASEEAESVALSCVSCGTSIASGVAESRPQEPECITELHHREGESQMLPEARWSKRVSCTVRGAWYICVMWHRRAPVHFRVILNLNMFADSLARASGNMYPELFS